MSKVSLEIDVVDRGANRLLDQLVTSVNRLQQAQGRSTAATRAQQAAFGSVASNTRSMAGALSINNKLMLQLINATNQQTAAQQRSAQAAIQQAAAFRQADQQTAALTARNRTLALGAAAAAAATYAVGRAFIATAQQGIEFNRTVENATLGIGALIAAQGGVTDANGKAVEGADAFAVAMGMAANQVRALRIAGLETIATTQQLVEAFQQATGPGLAAGLNLDEIRKVTVGIVQAAASIGVPMYQLNEEVRSILSGYVTMHSRVGKVLGINNDLVKTYREQGVLADYLLDRLQSFNIAGKEAQETWEGTLANTREAFEVFAGDMTQTAMGTFSTALRNSVRQMFDIKEGEVSEAFRPIVTVGEDIFNQLSYLGQMAMGDILVEIRELADWFDRNYISIDNSLRALGEMSIQLGGLVKDAAQLVWLFGSSGQEVGAITGTLRIAGFLVASLRDGLTLILNRVADLALMVNNLLVNTLSPMLKSLAWAAEKLGFEDAAANLKEVAQGLEAVNYQMNKAVDDSFEELLSERGGALGDYFYRLKQIEEQQRLIEERRMLLSGRYDGDDVGGVKVAPPKVEGDKGAVVSALRGYIRIVKQELSAGEKELARQFASGGLSINDYYDQLLSMRRSKMVAQIEATLAVIKSLEPNSTEANRLLADVEVYQSELTDLEEKTGFDRLKAMEDFERARRDILIDSLRGQGKTMEALELELTTKYSDIIKKMKAEGDTEGLALVDGLINIARARENASKFEETVKTMQDNLTRRLKQIDILREQGSISNAEAVRQTRDAYTEAISAAKRALPELERLARVTGSVADVAKVEELRQQILLLENDLTNVLGDIQEFWRASADALESGFEDFFYESAQHAASLGDVFANMADDIVRSIQRIIAQMMAQLAMQKLLAAGRSLMGAFGGGGDGGGIPVVDGPVMAATGGYIRGPGTGTSDSIPARLSHGEYVIRASAVKALGVDFLHELNSTGGSVVRGRRKPGHYATGGLVSGTPRPEAESGIDATLRVGLEDGIVLREIQGESGQRVLVEVLRKNRSAVRSALRI